MKKFRFAALLTTLALALVMPFAVAEETIDPAQLMEDVAGTYVPLFSVLNKPEYDDVAAAAHRAGVPFAQVWEAALIAAKKEESSHE